MQKSGSVVLDVRPFHEVEKAAIKGSINVELFSVDTAMDPASLMKQASAFGMGGWWQGGKHMIPNGMFLSQIQQQIPQKDAKVVVVCQKGLRSLAACEQLSRAGYTDLTWLSGGLDTVQPSDGVESVDGKDLRYGGLGGLSAVLGWTPVQQAAGFNSKFSVQNVIKGLAAFLVVDTFVIGYQYWEAYQKYKEANP